MQYLSPEIQEHEHWSEYKLQKSCSGVCHACTDRSVEWFMMRACSFDEDSLLAIGHSPCADSQDETDNTEELVSLSVMKVYHSHNKQTMAIR